MISHKEIIRPPENEEAYIYFEIWLYEKVKIKFQEKP